MFQAQLLSGPPPVRNGWIDELTAVILQRSRVLTAFAANRERTGFVDGARDVKVAGGVPEQDEFVIRDRSISRRRLAQSAFNGVRVSPPRGRQTFPQADSAAMPTEDVMTMLRPVATNAASRRTATICLIMA